MNPIIERLSDQPKQWWQKRSEIVNPLVEKLHEEGEKLRHRGEELLAELQERQEKLFDRGQKALSSFEVTALERVEELLGWAYGITGEKSDVLRKSRDFVKERLDELVEQHEKAETEEVERAEAKIEADAAEDKKLRTYAETGEEPDLPFEGYDQLGVKKLVARFAELDRDTLLKAKAFEESTKARKSVLDALAKQLE